MTRDAREVAAAVLAKTRRMARIIGGAERKVSATSLFPHTASVARGLMSQEAVLNIVKRMMHANTVARALVTEECVKCGTDSVDRKTPYTSLT